MNITIAPSRWYRLIPVAFITYSLAYLDRANFGFAAAGEMAKDLHITAATSSLLGSLFFLGYFFFQIPGAHYAANKSAKKLIFWSLILWGALAMATGLVSNIKLFNHHSFYAWCSGKCGNAFYAYFIKQVVYKSRTFTGQYFFNPWQSCHYTLDVHIVRVFN